MKKKLELKTLQAKELEKIHLATMNVLEQTGVKVSNPKVLELLGDAGARIDKQRVRIPCEMVEDALKKAPSHLTLGKRNGQQALTLAGNKGWFGPSVDCVDYLVPQTMERRRFRLKDCRVTATILDAMPHYSWGMTFGIASDVPPEIADRMVIKEVFQYCEKPLVFCCKDINSLKDIYEMAIILSGSEKKFLQAPSVILLADPISPLVHPDEVVEKMIFCAEKGIPQIGFGAPQAGSTAPATLAGTIVQGSAESLSGLVISQLICPGTPFIYGAFPTIMDMRTTVFSYGAPEMSLMSSAMAQLAQFYCLPSFGTAGCSDAKLPDSQAAAEATFSCYSSALSGVNLIHDCGLLDHGSLASPAYMVLVHEVIRMINQYVRGIEVNEETLALEIIEQVGPGGHFITEEHTLKHFKEVWYSKLFDRTIYETWQKQGGMSFDERLREQTLGYLEHRSGELSKEKRNELDRMAKCWQR